MRALIRETWLPTLLLALPFVVVDVFGSVIRVRHPLPPVGTLYALIVAPLAWWRTVAVRGPVSVGRSAARGALCGAVLALIAALCVVIGLMATGFRAGLAGAVLSGLVLLLALTPVLVPYGAGVGALVAHLRKRTSTNRSS